ncbi:MAG: M48 family metalloprotease [Burkholderiaceae bacterium]
MRSRFLALLSSVALLAGCATSTVRNPVTGLKERTVMNEASELATGKKAHQQVLSEYGVYPDAKLQAYVNELGQRLASQSERSQLEWHFTVLDSPEINAFALPGGYVYSDARHHGLHGRARPIWRASSDTRSGT